MKPNDAPTLDEALAQWSRYLIGKVAEKRSLFPGERAKYEATLLRELRAVFDELKGEFREGERLHPIAQSALRRTVGACTTMSVIAYRDYELLCEEMIGMLSLKPKEAQKAIGIGGAAAASPSGEAEDTREAPMERASRLSRRPGWGRRAARIVEQGFVGALAFGAAVGGWLRGGGQKAENALEAQAAVATMSLRPPTAPAGLRLVSDEEAREMAEAPALATDAFHATAADFASNGVSLAGAELLAATENLLGGPVRVIERGFHEPSPNAKITSIPGGLFNASRPGRRHRGVDMRGDTPEVLSAEDAIVIKVSYDDVSGWYPTVLSFRPDGEPLEMRYMHCTRESALRLQRKIREHGPRLVRAGEPIGVNAGNTGYVDIGPGRPGLVHVQMKLDGSWQDPLPFYKGEQKLKVIDIGEAMIRDRELTLRFQQAYNYYKNERVLVEDGIFGEQTAGAFAEAGRFAAAHEVRPRPVPGPNPWLEPQPNFTQRLAQAVGAERAEAGIGAFR